MNTIQFFPLIRMAVISLSGKYASRDRTGNNTPDYLEMYSLDKKNEVPGWSIVHGRHVNTPEAEWADPTCRRKPASPIF